MNTSSQTVEAIFNEALKLPPGERREELIAKLCAESPELQEEILSLLRAHERAGGFLQTVLAGEPPSSKSTMDISARPAPAPSSLDETPRLEGFRILHKLGQGGLGSVYAALDEKLNRRVAIKILHARSDASVRRRVLEEARAAAALAHPAIVTVYSVIDHPATPAIVMEWVEGFPIDRFAAELSFEQKARLLREVASGLSVAHGHGLIHRDLKPGNVMVGPDLRPRILDFGLALSLKEASDDRSRFEGTPLYASPEQAAGKPLTPASDIFSFGTLMFKMLTGKTPFRGDSSPEVLHAITTTSPPFLRDVALGVPEDLQAICLACLSFTPADRPSADQVALELGRFLVGEPVRLKPKLYDDLLRRSISEQSNQVRVWASQSIISREESDALEVVHRRLLADEDHWIIDARRITTLQTIVSGATWLAVVASILMVWMLHGDLSAPWRWLIPAFVTSALLGAGYVAQRQRENLLAATFLAGATLSIAPTLLALLAELNLYNSPPPGVAQLFSNSFSNQQVFVACLMALGVSMFSFWRLKMTGFAWTTTALAATTYFSFLLLLNWLDQKPEIQALWCLPLASVELIGLALERHGRTRWTMPFHLLALVVLLTCLNTMALSGPTLEMLGFKPGPEPLAFFNADRLTALSFVLNGIVFLVLMLSLEKAGSLDLRRASKLLEVLALLHILSALFYNALSHREDPYVRVDVWLYLGAALFFLVLAPLRSRWRMLVGGLIGCGLGSYLLVDLQLVARKPFILGLAFTGLIVAFATFAYVRQRQSIARVSLLLRRDS